MNGLKEHRVLVCGGRDFRNYPLLEQTLDKCCPDVIISGMARGADSLAVEYARKNEIDLDEYPADWDTHGKGAGFIRNQQMIDEGKPNLVVAFKGGRGTADMVKRSKKAGIVVLEIE